MLDRVLQEVERATDEVVDFTAGMIRIPTINPPGEHYEDCARYIGDRLSSLGFETEYIAAEGRPEHTRQYPRVNVVGTRHGVRPRPTVHLNGHFDVVPVGQGWTVDPFAGLVRNGRVYGRGACDMKAGIAAAAYAAEAIRRAGIAVPGTIEVSGTVDEESGGFAGVAYLAEHGRLSSLRTDYCIIPEPFSPDRVCVGHRGVYWFEVAARGHIAHGSMPFLGVNAIEGMGALLHIIQEELQPVLAARRPCFIDKPIAGSLADAIRILDAAEKAKVPLFCSSSLRFGANTQAVRAGSIGKVKSAETFSPMSLEPTHPDLYWYGVHGCEALFAVMGTGCRSVKRGTTADGKVEVIGTWADGRTGNFRQENGTDRKGYGGKAVGEKGEAPIGSYDGYDALLIEIVKMFRTGVPPVSAEETIELYAFMEAADESKRRNGAEVTLQEVIEKAGR